MKIGFVYGPWAIGGRPIDMSDVWDSPRGLTGSELSCLQFATQMGNRGHDTHLFMAGSPESTWGNVKVHETSSLVSMVDATWDVVYSWNEPDLLRGVNTRPLRMVNLQVNDFGFCLPEFDQFVDVYTSPSASHLEHVRATTPTDPNKWEVLPNGCDPSVYSTLDKDPNAVIWASSPDRGLHLLLQAWPSIRRGCPEATLKIFYNMDGWINQMIDGDNNSYAHSREFAYRAKYIKLALERMSGMGIQKLGSVSRNRMNREMSKASVLAYPCATILFTEGFSVTTMEACAAGVVPVISNIDSLGQIYGSCVPMVRAPVTDHMEEFSELVVKSLVDRAFRSSVIFETESLARNYSWDRLADRLETIISERRKN